MKKEIEGGALIHVTDEDPLILPSGNRLHFNEVGMAVVKPIDEHAIVPYGGNELKETMQQIEHHGMTESQAANYFAKFAQDSYLDEFVQTAYNSPSGS